MKLGNVLKKILDPPAEIRVIGQGPDQVGNLQKRTLRPLSAMWCGKGRREESGRE